MFYLDRIRERRALRKVFDREFYLRENPDVAAAGIDPLNHYLDHGAAEQRQPHPLFDPAHYLANCPEARSVANPLLYFVRAGASAWANPHPLFDCEAYMRVHPDASHPLADYVARKPHAGEEGCQFGQC